jgi:hypothetical protein
VTDPKKLAWIAICGGIGAVFAGAIAEVLSGSLAVAIALPITAVNVTCDKKQVVAVALYAYPPLPLLCPVVRVATGHGSKHGLERGHVAEHG